MSYHVGALGFFGGGDARAKILSLLCFLTDTLLLPFSLFCLCYFVFRNLFSIITINLSLPVCNVCFPVPVCMNSLMLHVYFSPLNAAQN